jgi:hypothetical protein
MSCFKIFAQYAPARSDKIDYDLSQRTSRTISKSSAHHFAAYNEEAELVFI